MSELTWTGDCVSNVRRKRNPTRALQRRPRNYNSLSWAVYSNPSSVAGGFLELSGASMVKALTVASRPDCIRSGIFEEKDDGHVTRPFIIGGK